MLLRSQGGDNSLLLALLEGLAVHRMTLKICRWRHVARVETINHSAWRRAHWLLVAVRTWWWRTQVWR